jgi:hypothetical protein
MTNLNTPDHQELARAVDLLEHPSFAAKVTNLIGGPVEKAITMLPHGVSDKLINTTQKALSKAMDLAVSTIDERYRGESADGAHRFLTSVSGAVGGAFGLMALTVELPISTTLMLRSIADIARSEGEPLSDAETKLECLAVFALGGTKEDDDGVDTGYFAIRAALAGAMTEAGKYLVEHGLASSGAPALVRFLAKIASRYSIQVSEKAAAQAIPLLGAAGGATINLVFMDHFQNMARGHFIVRRLERTYGKDLIHETYQHLATRN